MLFADLIRQWFEDTKYDWKPTTRGNYEIQVKRVLVPYFRKTNVKLCDLTADHIKEFFNSELKHLKATTTHKFYNNLSCALKYAMDDERKLISESPMAKIKRQKPKSEEEFTPKFLKQSEVIKVFDVIRGHKLKLAAILGAFYGLRRGEIVGLRWESIDFERNSITIEHTVVVAKEDGKKKIIESNTTKSKSSTRTLPLIPLFKDKLLAIKSE